MINSNSRMIFLCVPYCTWKGFLETLYEGYHTYIQGKYKPESSMRLFSSAGLSFINRKVVVYISTWGEQSLKKRTCLLSDHLIRSEEMSFISSLRPDGNYCRCNNTATTKAHTFKTDLQSLTYCTWGSQLASASCYSAGETHIASQPGLPSHSLHQTSQPHLSLWKGPCRICCFSPVWTRGAGLCHSFWCATKN